MTPEEYRALNQDAQNNLTPEEYWSLRTELFPIGLFNSHLQPRCDGYFKNGKKCHHYVKYFYPDAGYCGSHYHQYSGRFEPSIGMTHEEKTFMEAYDAAISKRIIEFYESLSEYRRVPPPEDLAYSLLLRLQGQVCFLCWASGLGWMRSNLIIDHCHRTGMVRALLCRSCNTHEGCGNSSVLETYRAYAPASGWYFRYFGRGEQWKPSYPDPLENRVTLEKIGCEDRSSYFVSKECVDAYEKQQKSLPTIVKTPFADRTFDRTWGTPELMPGERYLKREEIKYRDQWPIIATDSI